MAIARGTDELVGDSETEHAASKLMFRIDRENIPADRFGLLGIVEVAIQLDFGHSFGNAGLGDGF